MPNNKASLSPGKKAALTKKLKQAAENALRTAKWARIMTKWLITHSSKDGVKWQLVEFGGKGRQESKGIVDLIAIRKNHKEPIEGSFRGDLFEIVLIQVKGGSAGFPSPADVDRLMAVKEHHNAQRVILSEWKLGKALRFYELPDMRKSVPASEIFGKVPKAIKAPMPTNMAKA